MAGLIIFSFFLTGILIIRYYSLVRVYYMEKSLDEFREVKHQLILSIGESVYNSDFTDVIKAQKLLTGVNSTIEHLEKVKSVKFSSVKAIINNAIVSSEKLSNLPHDKDDKIIEFVKMYSKAVATSINSIPLLRLRLVVFMIKNIIKLLIMLGIVRSHNYLKRLDLFITAENQYFDHHCWG